MPESNLNIELPEAKSGADLAGRGFLKVPVRALLLFLFCLCVGVPDGIAVSGADTAANTGQSAAKTENGAAEAGGREGDSVQVTQSALSDLLSRMIEAYEAEDAEAFMAHVAGDFTGGRMLMGAAVRDDFSFFDNIDLQASVSNFAAQDRGYIYISVTYARRVTSARSGRTLQDSGVTEMVFKTENHRPRLYTVKNPVLFGVSDAANLAPATVNVGGNGRLLVVDASGEAAVLPFDRAMTIIEGTESAGP